MMKTFFDLLICFKIEIRFKSNTACFKFEFWHFAILFLKNSLNWPSFGQSLY